MSGKSDGGRRRSASFRSEMHTPKNNGGKSFMRGRAPTMPSLRRPSTPATPATPATPGTLRVAVASAAATPPMVRATLASSAGSSRDPRKFPAAANSTITTPSVHATSVSRLPPRYILDTMSTRKLDGVHLLSTMMEKQSQEPALSQSKSKFARGSQSKAKVEKKFDPRASDTDEEDNTSSSDDSDSDTPAVPSIVNKLNGQTSSSKPAGTPLKKAKRAKEDEVADSDAERKTSSAKPASTTKKAPVKPESSSEESSDSEAEAEASDSSDSSSESESESESNKKPAPKVPVKVAPTNGASTTSSSGSESKLEDEAAKRTRSAAKPAVNGIKVVKPASTSSSEATSSDEEEEEEEEGDDDDDDDGSSNEEDSSDEESNDNAVAVTARRNSNDLTVPGFVGKDFVLRKAQGDEDGKDMSDFFAKAKLDGKQLWYFTAPASVPINVIEKLQIPMDKAQNGDAIFKHNSEDYTVGFDVGSTAVQLLIPNKKGTRYEQASQKVDKVLHVKRVTQLVGSEPCAPTLNQPNAARPQPPGLKARFHPIGVSDGTPLGSIGFDASSDSDEDVDMAPAPALPSSSKKSKRASTQGDAMDIDEPTPKATKKDKKDKTARDPVQDSQSTVIEVPNSQPLTSKKDKKSKKRRDSIESISSVGSNPNSALLKGQKVAAATPDQSKKASKRKVPADEEDASAQLEKEAAYAEKKTKKAKRDADNSALGAVQASAKKVTAIPPPTIPTASYSLSNIPTGSSPTPQISTPLPKSKSKISKKSKNDELAILSSSRTASARKETPIQPPSVRRESVVPVPQVPFRSSPAAEETPKKEKHKRRKSEKTEEPKSAKKETPIPAPKI
ncbi:DNA-directed RNA polymerase I subunit [Colletotrichum navitas]|uniref:DNA-directed RNA polymerase I subunit n=1 Tax=Colletotrichum navitas TaxID=681940 RepID=A0AAD8V2R6_9PEZI|nr:DNA-directed RNA polymerase I subunit [Colletotrichum navitas]KAK1585142.1 DNA-directed RNA polymerase I subunit [Colletotrichum navitas]